MATILGCRICVVAISSIGIAVDEEASSVTDLYDRSEEDGKYRKEVAEQVGIGFEIPPIVPSVPTLSERKDSVAA